MLLQVVCLMPLSEGQRNVLIIVAAGLFIGFGLTAFAQTAKEDIKRAGRETKEAAQDAGSATKRTAKKAGHKVKHTTNKAASKVEEKTRDK